MGQPSTGNPSAYSISTGARFVNRVPVFFFRRWDKNATDPPRRVGTDFKPAQTAPAEPDSVTKPGHNITAGRAIVTKFTPQIPENRA